MLKEVRNLPDNWKKALIPEVLFFQEGPGVRKWQFTQEGVKLLNGGNINNNAINLDSTKIYISEEEAQGKYSHFMIDPGDLVIACSGIVVNKFKYKIAFIEEKHTPLCLNTSTMRFKSLGDIDLKYYAYFLQTEYFSKQLQRLITGSAQLNFGPSHIKKIEVLLPPLEEQKKIAAILDAADDYRQKTKALIDKYDQLTQSLFLDMFGDLSLKKTKWDILKIREVVMESKSGASIKPAEFTQNGFPVLHKGAVKKNGGIVVDSKKKAFVSLDACLKYNKSIVDKDYVVVTLRDLVPTGPSIGLISHLKHFEIDQYILAQGAYGLLLNEKLVNPTYMVHWSNSPIYRGELSKYWVGSTQIHLRSSTFFDLYMPLPNVELQNQFAERVAQIEKQKQQAEASLIKAEELFSSLLQRAFKGEHTS